MRFFGKKKKLAEYNSEMVDILVDLSGVSEETAHSFLAGGERFFEDCIDQNLDAFGAVWRICNNSMDRLCAAHQVGKLDLVEDIPEFILLVSARVAHIMHQNSPDPDEAMRNNNYYYAVCKIPIDPEIPERTYFDRIKELASAHDAKQADPN